MFYDTDDTSPLDNISSDHLFKNPAPMPREQASGGELYDSTSEAVYAAGTHGLKNFHIVRVAGGKYAFEKRSEVVKVEAEVRVSVPSNGSPFKSATKRHACYQLLLNGATVEAGIAAIGRDAKIVIGEYGIIAQRCGKKLVQQNGIYKFA